MPQRSRRRGKRVDKDTVLVIVNNTQGGFSYAVPGLGDIILRNQGDITEVTYGELQKMMSKGRSYFENLDLVIQEVIPEEGIETPTLETITTELRIDGAYRELLGLFEDELPLDETDYINAEEIIIDFLKDSSADELKKVMNNHNSHLRQTIAFHAAYLHKKSEFNDLNKMEIIGMSLGNSQREVQGFWNDIRVSSEPIKPDVTKV